MKLLCRVRGKKKKEAGLLNWSLALNCEGIFR